MLKRKSLAICVIILVMLVLSLTACSSETKVDTTTETNNSNPLIGKYYVGSYHPENYEYSSFVCTFRFNEDNTVQIVNSGWGRETDKRTSYYATYTLEGNALFVKFGSKEASGVILENGSEIRIGTDIFSECEPDGLTKATLEEFSQ